MPTRTLILKVIYAASTLAGTMLFGVPAYAQLSGTGTVIPPANSLPVISVPGASPLYVAKTAMAPDPADPAAFTTWITNNAAVQYGGAITPGTQGESTFVDYRFSVTDADGTSDIKDAQVRLLKPDGTVHTAFAAAKPLGTSSAITKEYFAQFELKSTDPPATGINFYKIVVKVADNAIQTGSLPYVDDVVSPKVFQYNEVNSLHMSLDTIDFGALQLGAKSTGVPVTLTNLGNVALDDVLSATHLVKGSDLITSSHVWYGPTSAAAGTNFPDAAANPKRDAGFNLMPGASRIVYLAIDVPANTPAGTYSTTITFAGAQHTGAACSQDCVSVSWS